MTRPPGPTRHGWACGLLCGLHGLALLTLAACQSPVQPAGPAPHTDLVREQLAQVVGQQTPPCGAVLQFVRHDRLDYRVACASGNVYRVRVGADGRVVVKPYEGSASAPQ